MIVHPIQYRGETFYTLIDSDVLEEIKAVNGKLSIVQPTDKHPLYVIIRVGNRKIPLHRWIMNAKPSEVVHHVGRNSDKYTSTNNLRESTNSP